MRCHKWREHKGGERKDQGMRGGRNINLYWGHYIYKVLNAKTREKSVWRRKSFGATRAKGQRKLYFLLKNLNKLSKKPRFPKGEKELVKT